MRTTGISAADPVQLFDVVNPLVAGQRALGGVGSVTVSPAGRCSVYVMVQADTWGLAGASVSLPITAPEGLTRVAYHQGTMARGDTLHRPLLSWGVWSGLEAGQEYEFSATPTTSLGNAASLDMVAICI